VERILQFARERPFAVTDDQEQCVTGLSRRRAAAAHLARYPQVNDQVVLGHLLERVAA